MKENRLIIQNARVIISVTLLESRRIINNKKTKEIIIIKHVRDNMGKQIK